MGGDDHYSCHRDVNFPTPEYVARMDALEKTIARATPQPPRGRDDLGEEMWDVYCVLTQKYPLVCRYYDIKTVRIDEKFQLELTLGESIYVTAIKGWHNMRLERAERALGRLETHRAAAAEIRRALPLPIASRVIKWLPPFFCTI